MDLWVILHPVHREAMDRRGPRDRASAETQHRKTLVRIVVLKDLAHARDRLGVLWDTLGGGVDKEGRHHVNNIELCRRRLASTVPSAVKNLVM